MIDLHAQKPFRAILSAVTPSPSEDFLALDDLFEDHPKWASEYDCKLPRKSDAWIEAVGLLLTACSELMFIDPFFDPKLARYQRTLKSLCAAAFRNNERIKTVEYHLKKRDGLELHDFEQSCKRELPIQVPNGLNLKIFIWEERRGGQEFHARYILTNHGGIRFDHGLDDNPNATTTTDVSLLGETLFKTRRGDFTVENEDCAFDLVYSFSLTGARYRV